MTSMPKRKPPQEDSRAAALRAIGALHPRPEAIRDPDFAGHEFFDPRDQVQVKYEMLRRHHVDGLPVTEVAARFRVSRQAFYRADAAFRAEGLSGLLPRRRGPKRAHKCTDEILDFAEAWRAGRAGRRGESVAEAVERRFGVAIHPRSIERALARRERGVRREQDPRRADGPLRYSRRGSSVSEERAELSSPAPLGDRRGGS
jgi:transposase